MTRPTPSPATSPAPRRYRPPTETVAEGGGSSLAAVRRAILACLAAAAIFGAEPLLGWAEALPVHPVSDRIVAAAAAWRDMLQPIGLNAPSAMLRERFRQLQAYQ
jgi:hypothetical protein